MILPEVIDKYLARDMDDFTWVETIPDAELDKELDDIGVDYSDLWRQQKEALLIGAYRPHLAIFHEMGLGKSLSAMRICQYHGIRSLLVLVPFRVQRDSWEEQLRRWNPPFYVDVMTYAAFRNQVCSKRPSGRKGKKTRMVLDGELAGKFAEKYQGCVVDESSLIGNRTSVIFECVLEVTHKYKVRLALSGTPFGRDPSLLWSQLRYVDRGKTLGEWGMFREVFFNEDYWGNPVFKKRMKKPLNRMVGNRSVRRRTLDCIDMPKRNYQRLEYDLPEKAAKLYDDFSEEMKHLQSDEKKKAIRECFTRLCQITSGFLYMNEEEGREVIDLGQDARISVLVDTLKGLDSPCIIFSTFQASHEALRQGLKKEKITATDDPEVWRKGNHQCLLLANGSGALGGNFQRACHTFFFESPVSPSVREQAEARTWRAGQDKPCFYYDLVAREGMDSNILGMLAQGGDLLEAIIDGKGI